MAGYGDTNNALNVKKTLTNFAPRTGVSWRLNDLTVVRAGYGVGIDPVSGQPVRVQLPGEAELLGHGAERLPARGHDGAGLPAAGARLDSEPAASSPSAGTLLNSTFDVIPDGLREGTLHSWNIAFQRQLPYLLTAEVAYVGNRGVDLVMDVDTQCGHGLRRR